MYYKQCTGVILIQKTIDVPDWVSWTHHSMGESHCEECLTLDGCFFVEDNHPPCPHHPYCHCTVDPIDYSDVLDSAYTTSDYSKFDPYLFDPEKKYGHGKNVAFEKWGYNVSDSEWLQKTFERQALSKYLSGDYKLGKLNENGQRISIRISIPRKDKIGTASFITGWMVYPNGLLKLTTPYGGK